MAENESQVKDNFSTFLKQASREWEQQAPNAGDEAPAPAGSAATEADTEGAGSATATAESPVAVEPVDLRLRLVAYLEEHGPVPIAEIQSAFGIGFSEVGPLVLKLQAAGLIDVVGDPGVEVVELTAQGKELA